MGLSSADRGGAEATAVSLEHRTPSCRSKSRLAPVGGSPASPRPRPSRPEGAERCGMRRSPSRIPSPAQQPSRSAVQTSLASSMPLLAGPRLCVYLRPSSDGVLVLLEHDQSRPFSHNEPVSAGTRECDGWCAQMQKRCFPPCSDADTRLCRAEPPRLSASKGRLDSAGASSLAVDRARIRANPATATGSTHASVPPATTTSASPARTILNPSPMLWAPENCMVSVGDLPTTGELRVATSGPEGGNRRSGPRTAGARGRRGVAGAGEAVPHADVAGGEVDEDVWDEKRAHFPRLACGSRGAGAREAACGIARALVRCVPARTGGGGGGRRGTDPSGRAVRP